MSFIDKNGLELELRNDGAYDIVGCVGKSKELIIPESYEDRPITCIKSDVFNDCKNLKSIIISKNIASIDCFAFAKCASLESIKVAKGNEYYDSRNNCNAIIEKKNRCLVVGCENTIIPSGIKKIGYNAFSSCYGLSSITIPESVREIMSGAFENCTALKDIAIPNGVKTLGFSSFEGCTKLTSIYIPDSVTNIGKSVFANCNNLEKIIVAENNPKYYSKNDAIIKKSNNALIAGCKNTKIGTEVKSIEESAFEGCTGLKSINIPNSVKKIERRAFYGCTELKSITFGSGLSKIGEYSFYRCEKLLNVILLDSVKEIEPWAFGWCTGLENIRLSKNLKSIKRNTFFNCPNLKSLEFGKKVENIDDLAFQGSEGLESITIDKGNPNYSSQDGILYDKAKTKILYIPNVEGDVVIPNGVTEIPKGAFQMSSLMTSLTIPSSVKEIKKEALKVMCLDAIFEGKNFVIKYEGTKEEWEEFEYDFYDHVSTIVQCKNGTITHKEIG